MGLIKDIVTKVKTETANGEAQELRRAANSLEAEKKTSIFKKIADNVNNQVNSVNDFFHRLNEPMAIRKIEKLISEGHPLYLFEAGKKDGNSLISVYDSDLVKCFEAIEKSRTEGIWILRSMDNQRVASFARKKRLYKRLITVQGLDRIVRTFEKTDSEDKVIYQMDKGFTAVKKNMAGDYTIFSYSVPVGELKYKPIPGIEYALQVFDENMDLEIFLITIGKIIY